MSRQFSYCQRPHCGGIIWDYDDGMGKHCNLCGRYPGPPPTATQLAATGVASGRHIGQETEGRKGRGVEYSPAKLGLVRPLTRWRR